VEEVTPAGDPPDPQAEPFGAVPGDDHGNGHGEDLGDDNLGGDFDRPDDPPFDDEDSAAGERHTALPTKVEAWRKRSATGAVLTGFALGLQQAFEKEREQPAIIMQTSGDPPTDLPVEADVEHGRPRQSKVSIRPWLLRNRGDRADPASETEKAAAGDTDAGRPRPGPGVT
jgi:hypothetical protein